MKKLGINLDTYSIKARLTPALLVILPIVLAVLAWFPNEFIGWGMLWGLLVLCGVTSLLAQIGRDWGRNKEVSLFESWGGKPTTCMLRHRDATNHVILARRHKKLKELLPEPKLPSPEEEQANPDLADQVYDACVALLREKTRDQKKFPLVFEELCNYGFRRNLWGMKPLGVALSLIGTGIVAVVILVRGFLPLAILCGPINLALLSIWLFWLSPKWVKDAADAYAERLLSACDSL